ncbi:MAG: MinD/ParA family protein [Candidatus Micrarchaeota archaeon]|nr:MinD/ParA family protein [Candidatus Micrarchaeota archaeon]
MQKPYIIIVSSPKGGVGKSVVSINLAVALKQMRYNVLIVDTDIINPCVGLYMGLNDTSNGVLDVISNKIDIKRAIVPHPSSGVRILPGNLSRTITTTKDVKITTPQIDAFMKKLSGLYYDFVIIDTQPGIEFPSALTVLDEAILVAQPNKASCISAIKMLGRYGKAKLKCNLIINRVRNKKFELDMREIEEMAETKVSEMFPEDEKVQVGVAEGVPTFSLDSKAPFSRTIKDLAQMYASRIGSAQGEEVDDRHPLVKIFHGLIGKKK